MGTMKQAIHKQEVLSDKQFSWSNARAAVSPSALARDLRLKKRALTPLMSINIGEILSGWMQDEVAAYRKRLDVSGVK